MMNKYILLIFLMMPFSIFANSNPYRGGEVNIEIKNETPCFYINDMEQKGIFSIVLLNLSRNSKDYWSYDSSFDKSYPTKNNCVVLNEKNFNGFKSLKENTPYSVTLGGVKTAYNRNFCITRISKKIVIQDFRAAQCVDRKSSFWDNLKNYFHK
ncbi:NF045616 family extracytoplasmic (lipo)protein [Acinetobacter sp. XH1741]|uniref:NF045616 family extracytoplasmic (lipo)protein n=2 Tax=Acinetobacter TaxID=469 RepID=UPI0034DB53E6